MPSSRPLARRSGRETGPTTPRGDGNIAGGSIRGRGDRARRGRSRGMSSTASSTVCAPRGQVSTSPRQLKRAIRKSRHVAYLSLIENGSDTVEQLEGRDHLALDECAREHCCGSPPTGAYGHLPEPGLKWVAAAVADHLVHGWVR